MEATEISNFIVDSIQKYLFDNVLHLLAAAVVLLIIWNIYRDKKHVKHVEMSENEIESMVSNWIPEPLVEEVPENHPTLQCKRMVTKISGKYIKVNDFDCLDLSTHNYLGLLNTKEIQDSASDAVRQYGVGSCGPHPFYGTFDVHLELEKRLADFMQMELAIVYSYGFSTVSSIVGLYCKRGDLVFVDECVNFAIQKGIDASRSNVFYFKHNDINDLQRLLNDQETIDRKDPKKAAKIRRFIIVEGIYVNTGEMCPLPEIAELRRRYKLRLILDESISFGSLGKNGRGIIEHFNVNHADVDIIISSLENAVGMIGGFSVGTEFIIYNQYINSLGHLYTASLPPFLAKATTTVIDQLEKNPKMFGELREKCIKLNEKLRHLTHFVLRGHELSPVKHLYLKSVAWDRSKKVEVLGKFVDKCIERNLAIANAAYLECAEIKCPEPSLRVISNRLLTDADIQFAFDTIENVSTELLSSSQI